MDKFNEFMVIERDLIEFRDFDKWMQSSVDRLPSSYLPKSAQHIAHLLFSNLRNYFFMLRVTSLKLFEIGRGILSAEDTKNASVFLSLARSFVEHTASLSYQLDIMGKAIIKLKSINTFEGAEIITSELDAKINVLFYGSSEKGEKRNFIHVNDMLKVMRKDMTDIEAIYNYLCDFVHPNYGSNRLVSDGIIGRGALLPDFSSFEVEINKARSAVESCAKYALECQITISKQLMEIGSFVDIAATPNMRVSQIFSTKTQYSGDGKTLKTAIFFDGARSHMEAILALNSYLKDTNTIIFSKDKQKFIDGYYVERLKTNKGFIWVRYLFNSPL